jgi:predicted metal-dependent hydrolase
MDSKTKDSIWVGFILLAVSAYHHRRSNFSGAKRTLIKAIKIFELQADSLSTLGIDKDSLFYLLNGRISALQKGESYKSFSLPISDPLLMDLAQKACEQKGFIWVIQVILQIIPLSTVINYVTEPVLLKKESSH